jgi:hypothetical protein
MIESKLFAGGGLNQDVDDNFIKPNDWDYALNIRNTDRLEFSDGIISNLKGNTLVTNTFLHATGDNKCIGTYSNEATGKIYSFIHNSLGYHLITELDTSVTPNVLSKVLKSDPTSLTNPVPLEFTAFNLINGAGIVANNLLYWTDGNTQPKGIDITKAKTSTYYTDTNSILLVKAPPQQLVIANYANDDSSSTKGNRLRDQLFQFRYLYVYEDGSRSAWSSCSSLPLPVLEQTSSVFTYLNNHILLYFNYGSKFVKTIEVAAQVKGVSTNVATTDWFNILTVDRSQILSSPLTPDFAPNTLTNTCQYKFYNDGLYQSVDVLETDLSYDYVPLKSKALEIANGNVLLLGNNTEGYDNIVPEATFVVSYIGVSEARFSSTLFSGIDPRFATWTGRPLTGDILAFSWRALGLLESRTFTVGVDTSNDLIATADAFGGYVSTESSTHDPLNYYEYAGYDIIDSTSIKINFTPIGTVDRLTLTVTLGTTSDSRFSYKTNSKYQFGLVYYDDFNRSSYVQTNFNNFIVSTDSFGATEAKIPKITWTVTNSAPTWATKYQWVRTEQLTHLEFLYSAFTTVAVNPDNSAYYDLTINLNAFNTKNKASILAYDWSKGDRCTIHKNAGLWITGYDVEVIAYNTTTGVLTIVKKDTLTTETIIGDGLLEIYTPKTRSNASTEQFFYEFGEQYNCTAGTHSVLTGDFISGDIYVKTRVYPVSADVVVEDPNFSDFYKSDYSSNGRANIFAPQAKQLNLPTDIRYSDTYVPNTNINGLSRFYGDAFDTYDRVNGSIQKLAVRDNYLICFQELKIGYIPIMQSIIEDQGGGNNANVAISTKLLNKIRYYVGDYGIGLNPESFARFAGIMYFADPNRGFVLKLSGGLEPISSKGMDSYFTKTLSTARSVTNVKLLGSYDPRNDEYLLTVNYVTGTGTSETIAFNENTNVWTSFYSFIPEMAGYIFNKYFSFKNGGMWEHNVNSTYNSFYGVAYPSIVQLTYNSSPKQIKSFLGVLQQGDSVWTAPDITTSTSTVSTPQHSSLIADDFSKKEGVWFSSLLRDDTSPGGLLEGDDLKGNWIKLRLSNSSSSKINLLSVDMRAIPSYQGIK